MSDMWADVKAINAWIDRRAPEAFHQNQTLALYGRVTKVAEECGEVMAALIGATGQNPRKGYSHSIHDVREELADVVVTALCALEHTSDFDEKWNTREIIEHKLEFVRRRANA